MSRITRITVGSEDFDIADDRIEKIIDGTVTVPKADSAFEHEAIDIKEKGLAINSLTETAQGKIYTGRGREWADPENLPPNSRDSEFCLEVLPNDTKTVHRYTFSDETGPKAFERSGADGVWSAWKYAEGGWKGTKAEYEKSKETFPDNQLVYITDDGSNNPLFVSNEVKQGELTPVSSNAVYEYYNGTNSIFQEMFDTLYPVGYERIQLPGEPEPNALFGQSGKIVAEWQDITNTVNQDFLKFDSTKAANTPEVAGLPNISGDVRFVTPGQADLGLLYEPTGAFSGGKTGQKVPSYKDSPNIGFSRLIIDASEQNPVYGKSSTVTPQNKSVKLWKRVK